MIYLIIYLPAQDQIVQLNTIDYLEPGLPAMSALMMLVIMMTIIMVIKEMVVMMMMTMIRIMTMMIRDDNVMSDKMRRQ